MIPTEIVDYILSFLQDYTTLETCSVVFPQLVDRHLYSKITFYSPSDSLIDPAIPINDKGTYVVDAIEFSRVLLDRPLVANYVRDIRIILAIGPAMQYAYLLPVISLILSSLSQIESIALSSNVRSTLNPEFDAAFQNSIRLPSIKAIAISNINGFSLDNFNDCKNLRDLLLYGVFQSDKIHQSDKSVSASLYPRLSSLRVDSRSDFTRFVSWVKSDTLHTLSLRMYGFPRSRTLIEACSATLVNLELDLNYTYLTSELRFSTMQSSI
jgi:hypothetical protein